LSPTVAVSGPEVAFSARIRKDHRIVIPKTERAILGVREGDFVFVSLRRADPVQGPLPAAEGGP
jgi:hypothetical protein